MPGLGPKTCGRGPQAVPEQATPGRACWQSPRMLGPGTFEVAREQSPAGVGRRLEQPEGSVRSAWLGSLSTSVGSLILRPAQAEFENYGLQW